MPTDSAKLSHEVSQPPSELRLVLQTNRPGLVGRRPRQIRLLPGKDRVVDTQDRTLIREIRTRPRCAMTAESAVFKFCLLIWQRFFSADKTDFAGDTPPIKTI
jgi:hypothetical protein